MNTDAILKNKFKQNLRTRFTRTGNVYGCPRYNTVKNELRRLRLGFEMNMALNVKNKPKLF